MSRDVLFLSGILSIISSIIYHRESTCSRKPQRICTTSEPTLSLLFANESALECARKARKITDMGGDRARGISRKRIDGE